MTTSMSRRLNIHVVCIMLKIIAFFIITLFVRYVRVGILLTCGKHLHDSIISRAPEFTPGFFVVSV